MDREKDICLLIDKALKEKWKRLYINFYITKQRFVDETGCSAGEAEKILGHLKKRSVIYLHYSIGDLEYYRLRYRFYPKPGRTIDLPPEISIAATIVLSVLRNADLCSEIQTLPAAIGSIVK
jgi:hypothetical protein